MWRLATEAEDDIIVRMSLALYAEDPGQPIDAAQIERTLAMFRSEPRRGRAVVAVEDGEIIGYALLVSFWSNEYGGEICNVDELYVVPERRGRGIATTVFDAVLEDRAIWPRVPVALELEVSPDNTRARALYERLGFRARNALLRRRAVR